MLKRGILQGVFSWDVHPPKPPRSLGSSGIEGWVPLCYGRRILFPGTSACRAAVWPQTQECLAQPLWRQITLDPGLALGNLLLCAFCTKFPGGFTCGDEWELGFPAGAAGTSVGNGCSPSAAGWEREQGALAGLGRCLQPHPGEPPLEQQGQASCLSRI